MGMNNSSRSVLAKTSEAFWVYGSCRDKCCTSIILHSSEIFMVLIELTSPWIALTLRLQKLTYFTFVKEGCCFTSKANGALAAYSSSFFCPACQQRINVADLISGSEDNRHLIVTVYSWQLTKPGMCGLYDTVKKEIVWQVHIIRLFMLWGLVSLQHWLQVTAHFSTCVGIHKHVQCSPRIMISITKNLIFITNHCYIWTAVKKKKKRKKAVIMLS